MKPFGEGKKQVLVIGEAPGQREDEQGRPFIGKAGQFLRNTLGEIGVELDEDCWTTNSLICRPPDNKTPDIKQIGYCRPNLLNALAKFKPRVVVTLGRSALVSVLTSYWKEIDTLERWIGWRIPLQAHWLCPTYHPSFLLRMKNQLMDRRFKEDLERAFAIERDPPVQPEWDKKIEVLYNDEEICDTLRDFARNDWFAFDYETNCLKPEYPKAQIVACSMSNGERTIAYPWEGNAIAVTGETLASKHPAKIASNLKFEEKWTRKTFGHGVRNWGWDTMIAAHCLDNRTDICSIKFQAFVKLGVPSYSSHIAPFLSSSGGWYNRIHHLETVQLLKYCGMDSLLEYQIAMIQRKGMGYDVD